MSNTRTATSRFLRVAGLTADVAGGYVGYLLQRGFLSAPERERKRRSAHARAGRRIRDELVNLRGPAMKLGQTLSLHGDLMSEDFIAEIASLQMSAPGMHPSLARATFRASLGAAPEDAFRQFDPQPFAAASLGQVHRAVTHKGDRVAVKIQYPDVENAARSDFKWFRQLTKPAQASGHVPSLTIDELEKQILAETDYRREADNIDFFGKGLAPLTFVEVPRVHRELSTDRVLTMSDVEGNHMDAFLSRRPSQAHRDLLGARLFELFYFQLLRLRALHADPHWGNYLFQAGDTIGLVDFGCVKYFSERFAANLHKTFLYDGPRHSAEFYKLLDERYANGGRSLGQRARRAFAHFAETFYRKVYPPDPRDDHRSFDFSDPVFLREYMREAGKVFRTKGALPEHLFLVRAELGLYTTLHRLRARVHTSAIVRKYLKR